jgi:hypothetical protein
LIISRKEDAVRAVVVAADAVEEAEEDAVVVVVVAAAEMPIGVHRLKPKKEIKIVGPSMAN